MTVYTVKSIREFHSLFEQHMKQKERSIKRAIARLARTAAQEIRKNAPEAFGPLRESVHATDTSVIVDAPYAASVELGSRPHMPPLDAIIAWVKKRGAQGLTTRGKVIKNTSRDPGKLTSAKHVASTIKSMQSKNGYVESADILQLARSIQMAIAKHGTKPHFFVRDSMPYISGKLEEYVKDAVKS